ncbi:MAG: biotin transporter BioY [Treponema sp.]|jgi:biotin transport system substrate-specific component|nr:biotin transporter BioY [Treponema sp.]
METSQKSGTASKTLRNRSVFTAFFAALIAVTCFISIPVGILGVPIVLQNMFVILAGALLGSVQGAAAVGLFIVAGALGLPVFAGGRGGFAVLAGPTGGYLAGYFIGSLTTGLILGRPKVAEKKASLWQYLKIMGAALAGFAIIDVLGAFHLMRLNSLTPLAAVMMGIVPFAPGDLIKAALLIPLTAQLRPIAARYIGDDIQER